MPQKYQCSTAGLDYSDRVAGLPVPVRRFKKQLEFDSGHGGWQRDGRGSSRLTLQPAKEWTGREGWTGRRVLLAVFSLDAFYLGSHRTVSPH